MFYALPLREVFNAIFLCILLWVCMGFVFRAERTEQHKIWKYINCFLCIASVGLIIKMTLWGRREGVRQLQLMPFYTLTTISYNGEAIRTMVMNIVLFLPFGLTLPYVFDHIKNKRRKWLLCIWIGFLVSVGVESIQYVFALGRAETDDVICNTLGCALGVLAEVVAEGIKKR